MVMLGLVELYLRSQPGINAPSKIRTAVGKSLTRRAARRAAVTTDGEGTRSYANALFRLRCNHVSLPTSSFQKDTGCSAEICRPGSQPRSYLKLKNILHRVEFVLVPASALAYSFLRANWRCWSMPKLFFRGASVIC